eukprot:gene6453-18402_t
MRRTRLAKGGGGGGRLFATRHRRHHPDPAPPRPRDGALTILMPGRGVPPP